MMMMIILFSFTRCAIEQNSSDFERTSNVCTSFFVRFWIYTFVFFGQRQIIHTYPDN